MNDDGIDCYDACSTGDCEVCPVHLREYRGWRRAWMEARAWFLRRFAGRYAP
jgi:hypothetical protein